MEAKKLRFTSDLDTGLGPLQIDAPRFHQIVWNLLSNAVKFTPNKGHIHVGLMRINSHALLQVSDSGEGIAPEFLPHVFDRFRQADSSRARRYGGLGVGLAIVKHLVELHGGTVSAKSEGIGTGSTFEVKLPIPAFMAHQELASEQIEQKKPTLKGSRILVVEDEADTREMIAQALEQREATVFQAASAEEALEFLHLQSCDLVVSDIGMPTMDGYELVRRLRTIDSPISRLPAIALTAYAGQEDRKLAAEVGFNWHLPKPVKLAELIRVVIQLLAENGKQSA